MTPYAGLITRLGALAVDSVLLAIAVPVLANGPASVWAALAGQAPGWLKLGAQIVAALLPATYFSVCWWGSGQTAGGLLFGTVVCRHGRGRLGFGRALARALVGLLLPALWLAGLLGILLDRERRALHDRLFGTVVLRKLSASEVTRRRVRIAMGPVGVPPPATTRAVPAVTRAVPAATARAAPQSAPEPAATHSPASASAGATHPAATRAAAGPAD